MPADIMGLHESLPGLQQLVESAERDRDVRSVDVLTKYLGLHLGDLLPLTSTMSQGIFEQLITALGAADTETTRLVRQRYTALWELFIRENMSGLVGPLLAKEIVLAYALLELATSKLVRFFPYAGSKEGRIMESLHSRYLKSLKMFQKRNGKLPSMAVNLTQINLESPTKGQQAYG